MACRLAFVVWIEPENKYIDQYDLIVIMNHFSIFAAHSNINIMESPLQIASLNILNLIN